MLVEGRSVVDLGAGGGVVALAAARAGAARVLAADTDRWAADAVRLNAALNGVRIEVTTDDLVGRALEGWDVVLAGDITYGEARSRRVAAWLRSLASEGVLVRLGDPGRGHVGAPEFEPVARYQAPTDVDPGGIYLREACVYRVARLTGSSKTGSPGAGARPS